MFPPSNLPAILFRQIQKAEERSGRVYESVIGVVTDNKDPEGLARVKVKYPSLNSEETSWWAPIAALGAGDERGWFFLPEVDDEVLVMFEHGDIGRPVVIGALWNGKDAPPESNDGGNERRTIVSREGSKITFDDDKGTITLEDGGGAGTIEISTENTITITAAQGDACFLAPAGQLTIVANEIQVDANVNFHLDAKGIKLGSDAKVNLKASGIMKVHGSQTQMNGTASAPAEACAHCEEVPDPLE